MSETKPPAINRMDPQWGMFAVAVAQSLFNLTSTPYGTSQVAADFADAMIRERDRRDREEQE